MNIAQPGFGFYVLSIGCSKYLGLFIGEPVICFSIDVLVDQPWNGSACFKKQVKIPDIFFCKSSFAVIVIVAKSESLVNMGFEQAVETCLDCRVIRWVYTDIFSKTCFEKLFEPPEGVVFN